MLERGRSWEMKSRLWLFVISFVVLVSGCSSPPLVTPPTFSIDKEVWSGTATKVGIPDTFVRLTFTQTGKNVQGALELGQSATTLQLSSQFLRGSLEGTTLSVTTDNASESVTGIFNEQDNTFTGTLILEIDGVKGDFALSMNYIQNTP